MQSRCRYIVVTALLFLALLLSTLPAVNTSRPVQAADDGFWELRDAQWVLSESGDSDKIYQSGLSGMKVNVLSGVVSCDHTGTGSSEDGGIRFNQKITITMRGTYTASSGMSGTYTSAHEGTMTVKGKQSPLGGSHSGTFTGPRSIAEGQSYVISFSGGKGIITGAGGSAEATDHPFQIKFTVYKVQATPQPPSDSDSYLKASFSGITGQVEFLPPGADPVNGWKFGKLDSNLVPGTRIKTGEDSTCILSFSDMSTFVMKPETQIVLTGGTGKDSKIGLVMGNIWTNIKKMVKDGSMEIDMTQAVAGIKGTILVCEQTANQSIVKVVEGTVQVKSKATGKVVNVTTGNMVTATPVGLGQITSFDVSQEKTKWQDIGKSSSPVQSQESSADGPHFTIRAGNQEIKISPPKCFIATAAYGSETAKELDTFRAFRDRVLLKSRPGRLFVYVYYTCSPPAAEFIARHETIRTLVRVAILDPVAFLLDKSQNIWNK